MGMSSPFLAALFFFFINLRLLKGDDRGLGASFIFGDSLVDAGNNNYLQTLSRANVAPNGIDFLASGGSPTGRYYQSSQLGQEYPKLQMLSLMISSTISGANSRYNSQSLAFDNIVSLSVIKGLAVTKKLYLLSVVSEFDSYLNAICNVSCVLSPPIHH